MNLFHNDSLGLVNQPDFNSYIEPEHDIWGRWPHSRDDQCGRRHGALVMAWTLKKDKTVGGSGSMAFLTINLTRCNMKFYKTIFAATILRQKAWYTGFFFIIILVPKGEFECVESVEFVVFVLVCAWLVSFEYDVLCLHPFDSNDRISFFVIAETYSFVRWSDNGYLGSFPIFTFVNRTAINIVLHNLLFIFYLCKVNKLHIFHNKYLGV